MISRRSKLDALRQLFTTGPLALARNRTAITQFRLNSYVAKTGIYNNTLIGLLLSIIDLGQPLIDADDRRHAGRRPQRADVPRTPITHSDDAGPNSV